MSTGTTTEYAGNYIYQDGTLQFFSTPEGYVTPDGMGGYDYVYQYKDHLGNIRLSYSDGNGDGDIDVTGDPMTTEIIEENNYYPFGLKHKGYNDSGISSLGNDVAQKWKFGGKEYDDTFDINTYDFGARNYDPALGRWMNIDPLAEQMRRHSPYNYAFDNPVYYIDPDGMMPIDPKKKVVSSQKVGNTNPVTQQSHATSYVCVQCTHTIPTSGESSVGINIEFSAVEDDVSSVIQWATEGNTPEFTYSVSSENTLVESQYFDAEGNAVNSIDEATSFQITKSTETTTVNIENFEPKEATVTKSSSVTTYEIGENSRLPAYNGKHLVNGNTVKSTPTTEVISYRNVGNSLKNLVHEKIGSNLKQFSNSIEGGVEKIIDAQGRNFNESLKKM